ncbi:MAG TPA: Uma2 family endonuclease [Methylomirabilota bacterium]|jgi:Uma2 family endonuclease|nr:Uma2 family endonuclease [Methylomirabilota bacterium]
MAVYRIRTRRWTRAEYDRLVASGTFHPGERLELLDGQLVVREPQGSRHAVAIELALSALQGAFGSAWRVRVQLPVALEVDSEPEPDLSVVAGDPRASSRAHPPDPVLIVEVADASLAFDREHKAGLYARARVADYWIVNLVDQTLEVYREPALAPLTPFGWRYVRRQVLGLGASVFPLAAPSARIGVADLLP